jgi:hypothetical protein
MLHYAVYRKQPQAVSPGPAAGAVISGRQTPSGDDVFGLTDKRPAYGAGTMISGGQAQPSDDVFSTPSRRPATLGAWSLPTRGRDMRLPSMGSPRQSRRQLSGDFSNTRSPKSPRLGHHSDIGSARREITSPAQAAEFATERAETLRRETQSQRAQDKLNHAASRRDDLYRRRANALQRRSELEKRHEANIADLNTRLMSTQQSLFDTRQELAQRAMFMGRRVQLFASEQDLQSRLEQITQEQNAVNDTFQRNVQDIDANIELVQNHLLAVLSDILPAYRG